jgi:WhiB family redox-sensing transcriptional regulator
VTLATDDFGDLTVFVAELSEAEDAEPWRDDAACMPPEVMQEWFFPESSVDSARAIRIARGICARCPVRRQCLEVALSESKWEGVWAGTTAKQRRRVRRLGVPVSEQITRLLTEVRNLTTTGPWRSAVPEEWLEEGPLGRTA